jgi:hypothetical protein
MASRQNFISAVSYLCARWDVVAGQLGGLMDEPRWYQGSWRMKPQRLVEHAVQVRQLRQVILGDRLVTAHILDLPEESILKFQQNLVNI